MIRRSVLSARLRLIRIRSDNGAGEDERIRSEGVLNVHAWCLCIVGLMFEKRGVDGCGWDERCTFLSRERS